MVKRVTASVVGVLVGLAATWLIIVAAQRQPARLVTWGPQPTPAGEHTQVGVVALMWSAGCEGEHIAEERGVHEVGMCIVDGHEVTVAVFASSTRRDEWAAVMSRLGSMVVTRDRWAVAGNDAAGPEAFVAAVPDAIAAVF